MELSKDKMINIRLYFTHKHVESELDLKDKNVVVIDVLRTSTTMVIGLSNGAKEIIPTVDVATAGLIGRNSMGQSLLCGERNGKLIEGFQLGNSVKEYSKENVSSKTLIFSSTNGTPAIVKSKFARNCIIASFANISRVVEYITAMNENFVLLCSGKTGDVSLEDTLCAGMIIHKILKKVPRVEYLISDSARVALKLYSSYKNDLIKAMYDSEHGKFLVSIGFESDLADCIQVDICSCLPVMRNGLIKLVESFDTDPKLSMKKVGHKTVNT